MDIPQLRMFAAVAEIGNLTQAAERLHLSQPAASAQIKLLETEFGLALFDRKPTGLVLTNAGASLLPAVRQLLTAAGQIVTQAKNLRGRLAGSLKFAAVPAVLDNTVLPVGDVVSRMIKRHPLLNIELRQHHSRAIKLGVAKGEIDAGVVLGDSEIPNVARIVLKQLTYRVVASPAWRDRIANAPWDELAALPWVSCPGTHREMVTQLFKPLGCHPRKIIEADSDAMITSLLFAGAGLGLMRDDLALTAEDRGNLFTIERGRANTHVQFIYHNQREGDPTIGAVLESFRELCPNIPTKSAASANSVAVLDSSPA